MKPVIISEATSRGVVIYADGQPVLVVTRAGQLAKLGESAFQCRVPLVIGGEPYDLTDHLLCMKLAEECAQAARRMVG